MKSDQATPYIMEAHPYTSRSYASTICALPDSNTLLYFHGSRVYLNDIVAKTMRSFNMHKAPVTALALHPEGLYAISGDTRGRVCVWYPQNLSLYHEFEAGGKVISIQVNSEGRKVLIANESKQSLMSFDLELKTTNPMPAGGQINTLCIKHTRPFLSAACSIDGQVNCYNGMFKPSKSTKLTGFPVSSCWNPSGAFLFVGCMDGSVVIFDKDFECVGSQSIHQGAVYQIVLCGDKLATCSGDGSVKVWSGEQSLELVQEWKYSQASKDNFGLNIVSLCYRKKQNDLVCGTLNSQIAILDLNSKQTEIQNAQCGLNGPINLMRVVASDLFCFQYGSCIVQNKNQIVHNCPDATVLDINQFGARILGFTSSSIFQFDAEQSKFKDQIDTGINGFKVFKRNENEIIIVTSKQVYNLNVETLQKDVLFNLPEDYEEIVNASFNNRLALGMKHRVTIKKNAIVLLSEDFKFNGKISNYFATVAMLHKSATGLLAGGSDQRICYFKDEDFNKDEEDIWPSNSQMDYSKSAIGRARCCQFVGDIAYVGGDAGMLSWDITVCKASKKWEKVHEGIQVEAVVQYNDRIIYGGDDGFVRMMM
ncbi:WD40_domain-containing protein [Hexamita inflata]|uniref:WD40 domain-containing protein n=1 Tax=Hexamita inflata TaxID=28002 RepID=A0AA86U763_9EUKA|nr:WD40 domain-containing protein [Hexamita inflata]